MAYYDIQCPYCKSGLDIDHDDGQGYEEDTTHQQRCDMCDKTFVFTTSVNYTYYPEKADCLNGGEHRYIATHTYPIEYTKMRCEYCDEERYPTTDEMTAILSRVVK